MKKNYNNNFKTKKYFRFAIERHANEPLSLNDTCFHQYLVSVIKDLSGNGLKPSPKVFRNIKRFSLKSVVFIGTTTKPIMLFSIPLILQYLNRRIEFYLN